MDNGRRGFLKGLAAFAAATAVGGSIKLDTNEDYEKLDKEWEEFSKKYLDLIEKNPLKVTVVKKTVPKKDETAFYWHEEFRAAPVCVKYVLPKNDPSKLTKPTSKFNPTHLTYMTIDDVAWGYYMAIQKFFIYENNSEWLIRTQWSNILGYIAGLHSVLNNYTWDLYHADHWTYAIGRAYLLLSKQQGDLSRQYSDYHIQMAYEYFKKIGMKNPGDSYQKSLEDIYKKLKLESKNHLPKDLQINDLDKEFPQYTGINPWKTLDHWKISIQKDFEFLNIDFNDFEFTNENGKNYVYQEKLAYPATHTNLNEYPWSYISSRNSAGGLNIYGDEFYYECKAFDESTNMFKEAIKGEYEKETKRWVPKSA